MCRRWREAQSKLELDPFFAQWLDGTGAPAFTNKYTVFRLGNNKGFRTVGSVSQDLDLFKMPVELRIETDGKTEERRVDVSGTRLAVSRWRRLAGRDGSGSIRRTGC